MGPHKIPLISANVDQNNIFKIVLDISPDHAERLLYQYPTSESRIFDECVKLLKNLLCKKPRHNRRRYRGVISGKDQIQSSIEYTPKPGLQRQPGSDSGGDATD